MAFNPKLVEALIALLRKFGKADPRTEKLGQPDLFDPSLDVPSQRVEKAIPEGKDEIEGQLGELATNPQAEGITTTGQRIRRDPQDIDDTLRLDPTKQERAQVAPESQSRDIDRAEYAARKRAEAEGLATNPPVMREEPTAVIIDGDEVPIEDLLSDLFTFRSQEGLPSSSREALQPPPRVKDFATQAERRALEAIDDQFDDVIRGTDIPDVNIPGEKRTIKPGGIDPLETKRPLSEIMREGFGGEPVRQEERRLARQAEEILRQKNINESERGALGDLYEEFEPGLSGGVRGTTEVVEPERLSQAQLKRLNESGIGADLEDFEGGFVSRENPGFSTVSEQKKAFGSDVEITDDIIRAIERNTGETISDTGEVSVAPSRQVAEQVASRTKLLQDIDDELQKGFALFEPIEEKLPIAYRQSGGGVERGTYSPELRGYPKRFRELKQPLAVLRERWKIIKESLSDTPDMFQSSIKELKEELEELLAEVIEYNQSIGGALKSIPEDLLEGTVVPTPSAGRVSTQLDEIFDPSPKHLGTRRTQATIDEMLEPDILQRSAGGEFDPTQFSRFGTTKGHEETFAQMQFLKARDAARNLTKRDKAGQAMRDALIARFKGASR